MHGRDEKCVQNFGRKTRRRRDDNVRMELREVGWEVDWIHLA